MNKKKKNLLDKIYSKIGKKLSIFLTLNLIIGLGLYISFNTIVGLLIFIIFSFWILFECNKK